MKTISPQSKPAVGPNGSTNPPIPARDRVLEVAGELFAEAGFHGTHFREICKRAGTNVAGVCYHFRSKEGLYEAVVMEAGRRLADHADGFLGSRHAPAEKRLLTLVESLLRKLGAERARTAKLLTRELVDPVGGARLNAASGLGRDFILLQALMRELLGTRAEHEAVRLHALSLISECVFYCLAAENMREALARAGVCVPGRARLARLIAQHSLGALQRESTGSQISNP